EAACDQHTEVVLAVGNAVFSGLAEPLCRADVVRLTFKAFGVKHRQIVHRFGVAFIGSSDVELLRGGKILFHALALFEHAGEAELRRGQALVRGPLEPTRRLFEIGRNATALGETHGHFVGSPRIPAQRSIAQSRTADTGGQTVGGCWRRRRCQLPARFWLGGVTRNRGGDLVFRARGCPRRGVPGGRKRRGRLARRGPNPGGGTRRRGGRPGADR